jgi:two-component system sensor histidine kinase/response regulator
MWLKTSFNPDFHTTTPGTNNEKGTGLGLRFCKQAVEKHNGTLRVESEPGYQEAVLSVNYSPG